MNHLAQGFIDTYGRDVINSMEELTLVLAKQDAELPVSRTDISSLFLAIGISLVDSRGQPSSKKALEFLSDVHFGLDKGTQVLAFSLDYNAKTEYLEKARSSLAAVNRLAIQDVLSLTKNVLDLFLLYDKNCGSTAREGLSLAIERYATILISCQSPTLSYDHKFMQALESAIAFDPEQPEVKCNSKDLPRHSLKIAFDEQPDSDQAQISASLKALDSLIGLDGVKEEMTGLISFIRIQRLRSEHGLPVVPVSYHMVFLGNPGTGKTTVARIIARIYKALGILSSGHLTEVDRSSLIGGYLGQTALKTRDVLEQAKGGILFIDEAYNLCPSGNADQYGQEAISTILKYMEDHRDDLVVIVAGYEGEMIRFLGSNPGLQSRFAKKLRFVDYSALELVQIFEHLASQAGYTLSRDFNSRLKALCQLIIAQKEVGFGNARTIRNLFEFCITNHASRVIELRNPTNSELTELTDSDIAISDVDRFR